MLSPLVCSFIRFFYQFGDVILGLVSIRVSYLVYLLN